MYTLKGSIHMSALFIYIQTRSVILSTFAFIPMDKTIKATIYFYGCYHWYVSVLIIIIVISVGLKCVCRRRKVEVIYLLANTGKNKGFPERKKKGK